MSLSRLCCLFSLACTRVVISLVRLSSSASRTWVSSFWCRTYWENTVSVTMVRRAQYCATAVRGSIPLGTWNVIVVSPTSIRVATAVSVDLVAHCRKGSSLSASCMVRDMGVSFIVAPEENLVGLGFLSLFIDPNMSFVLVALCVTQPTPGKCACEFTCVHLGLRLLWSYTGQITAQHCYGELTARVVQPSPRLESVQLRSGRTHKPAIRLIASRAPNSYWHPQDIHANEAVFPRPDEPAES